MPIEEEMKELYMKMYAYVNSMDFNAERLVEDYKQNSLMLTDIEIQQIEDEQMLTDHDIAILELQQKGGE